MSAKMHGNMGLFRMSLREWQANWKANQDKSDSNDINTERTQRVRRLARRSRRVPARAKA